MEYFVLSPEVAGQLGPRTVMSHREHPPIVTHLHYVFDGWLGDDLVESFPCYIVTQRLADALQTAAFSGAELRKAEIDVSEEFREANPNRLLPPFKWLHVTGEPGINDFGTDSLARLVVSGRVLAVLQTMNISDCNVAAGWRG